MKKILAMLLSVAIIATIAIGGSIAYLQDTDETVNTMVMGNVDIEQIEQERKEGTDELITFRNAQKLYPATYNLVTSGTGSEPDETPSVPAEKVPGGFYKGIVGAMDKIVHVENVGKSEAYIRTWFAFEADNTTTGDNAGLKYIHINWNDGADAVAPVKHGTVKIGADENEYVVYSVTYPNPIQPGAATPYSLLEVFMDKAATNEYVAQFGDTYEILVLSQGVQAENFEDAAQAFTNAFGNQHPWTGRDTIAVPTIVKTEAELMAAINSIGSLQADKSINITLGANITLSENWSAPSFNKFEGANGNVTIVIDGNGYSINGLTVNSNNESAGLIGKLEGDVSFTARNLTLNNVSLTGNNTNSGYSCGGALIGYCGAWNSPVIDNVTVNGVNITGYKYIGGLIGYETTDSAGLVKKAVTVSNCSVNNATLNSTFTKPSEGQTGDVGGLIGQAYSAKLTGNTVKDTIITGSTDENRHGAMIGTAQAPVVIGTGRVENVKINDTPVKQDSNRKIVGSIDSRNDKSDSVTVVWDFDPANIVNVSNATQLHDALTALNSAGDNTTRKIVLANDITLGAWTPVSIKFPGADSTHTIAYNVNVTLDGNGHTIQDLTVEDDVVHCGLIGRLSDFSGKFSVKNLTLQNVKLTGSDTTNAESSSGALIAWIACENSNISIENVCVNGGKIENSKYIGGLIGNMSGSDTADRISVSGCSVTGVTLNSTYTETKNGITESKGHVGGLVGYVHCGTISNGAVSNVTIIGSTNKGYAGALVGSLQANGKINTASVNNVTINGTKVTDKAVGTVNSGASSGISYT